MRLFKFNIKKIALAFFLLVNYSVFAQKKQYPDGHDGFVSLPLGDISFADTVISYKVGNPAPIQHNSNPQDAVGVPDFNAGSAGFAIPLRNDKGVYWV
ncbi:MAG TPA: hypothetical protein VK835_11340 [Bacteroidia bacterium]|nr:hypothetical protein [Bacteroidia bacterium]